MCSLLETLAQFEVLNYLHTLESKCTSGESPESVLSFLSDIAPLISPVEQHTNAAQIFRWYGNDLLKELHPFFIVIQLCPEWNKEGHLISFSEKATSLCAALCNLSTSLALSPTNSVSGTDLINFTLSIFPSISPHRDLIKLTACRMELERVRRKGGEGKEHLTLIRTVSPSTYAALTLTETDLAGDRYITQPELSASIMYNLAKRDVRVAPARAIEVLLKLILHCKKTHLLEWSLKSHLLLAEVQIHLKLYNQALSTVNKVFVAALFSTDSLLQCTARWLYVQCKMATCQIQDRFRVFRSVERHLHLAGEGFHAHTDRVNVCAVMYFTARLYDEFNMRDDRNKYARKFRNFTETLSVHDPV
eukprot:sb/3465986/